MAWIRIQINDDVDSGEVRTRLETEDFEKVAGEVGNPAQFADQSGYVGWVPKGAFPDLEHLLFDDIEGDRPTLKDGEKQHLIAGADKSAPSQTEAAELLNVSRETIQNARIILDEGTPEEIADVESGEAVSSRQQHRATVNYVSGHLHKFRAITVYATSRFATVRLSKMV